MPKASARDALLEAAIIEFAEHGLTGVRIEHVAARAGCNKALVYRYFGDREGLFEAALGRAFRRRHQILESIPAPLGEAMVAWFRANSADQSFLKLVQREALANEPGQPLVEQEFREQYYASQVGTVEQLQREGSVHERYEPRYLFLALLALTIYPYTFPQICRLVAGKEVGSRSFRQGWGRLLSDLAESLRS